MLQFLSSPLFAALAVSFGFINFLKCLRSLLLQLPLSKWQWIRRELKWALFACWGLFAISTALFCYFAALSADWAAVMMSVCAVTLGIGAFGIQFWALEFSGAPKPK